MGLGFGWVDEMVWRGMISGRIGLRWIGHDGTGGSGWGGIELNRTGQDRRRIG